MVSSSVPMATENPSFTRVNARIPVSHTDCVTPILEDDDDHFPRLANRRIAVLRTCLKFERRSRVRGQLLSGRSYVQTRIKVNNAGRPLYYRHASGVSCELTQPFHGLVQDIGIRAGIEVCGGFHGASAGLQQERNRREGGDYLFMRPHQFTGFCHRLPSCLSKLMWFTSKKIHIRTTITLDKYLITRRILIIALHRRGKTT